MNTTKKVLKNSLKQMEYITKFQIRRTVSGTNKSDELPVMAGDEIEIQFSPSCPKQTEAYFTMPDGTSHKATVNVPTFKWTVPSNFTAGMQIKGETHYETENFIYNRTGTITLIAIE